MFCFGPKLKFYSFDLDLDQAEQLGQFQATQETDFKYTTLPQDLNIFENGR